MVVFFTSDAMRNCPSCSVNFILISGDWVAIGLSSWFLWAFTDQSLFDRALGFTPFNCNLTPFLRTHKSKPLWNFCFATSSLRSSFFLRSVFARAKPLIASFMWSSLSKHNVLIILTVEGDCWKNSRGKPFIWNKYYFLHLSTPFISRTTKQYTIFLIQSCR